LTFHKVAYMKFCWRFRQFQFQEWTFYFIFYFIFFA
jgi:hypothetical protein